MTLPRWGEWVILERVRSSCYSLSFHKVLAVVRSLHEKPKWTLTFFVAYIWSISILQFLHSLFVTVACRLDLQLQGLKLPLYIIIDFPNRMGQHRRLSSSHRVILSVVLLTIKFSYRLLVYISTASLSVCISVTFLTKWWRYLCILAQPRQTSGAWPGWFFCNLGRSVYILYPFSRGRFLPLIILGLFVGCMPLFLGPILVLGLRVSKFMCGDILCFYLLVFACPSWSMLCRQNYAWPWRLSQTWGVTPCPGWALQCLKFSLYASYCSLHCAHLPDCRATAPTFFFDLTVSSEVILRSVSLSPSHGTSIILFICQSWLRYFSRRSFLFTLYTISHDMLRDSRTFTLPILVSGKCVTITNYRWPGFLGTSSSWFEVTD